MIFVLCANVGGNGRGLYSQTMSLIKSAKVLPSFYDDSWKGIRRETLDALCKTLDVSVCDLFEYVAIEEKKPKAEKGRG